MPRGKWRQLLEGSRAIPSLLARPAGPMSLLGCDTSNDIVSIGRSSKAKLFLSVAACAAAVYTGLLVALELGTSRSIGLLWLMVCIKPIPCLAFAAVAWTSSGVPFQAGAIAAGLIAGAIGDFLLSFPKEDLFIPGLIAFAVGHIAYIVAFSRGHRFATHRIVPWSVPATPPPRAPPAHRRCPVAYTGH